MGADLGAACAGECLNDLAQLGRTLTHQALRAWSPLSPRGVPWAGEGFAGAAFVPLSRTAGEGGARRVSGGRVRVFGPDQRDGLGEVADEIQRPAEQYWVDPRHREVADLASLRRRTIRRSMPPGPSP